MPRHSESTLAAIKQAVDIVALVGEYLPLQRSGTKFKALCPFHDDHNPSMEVNPERQLFKCWSCGAGGDVFEFVQRFERVDFPEALRMLAERAGVALDVPVERATPRGPSKTDLLDVLAWAESRFAEALAASPETLQYVARRGITDESVRRFGLGLAPDRRDWLLRKGGEAGHGVPLLEAAGLITRSAESNLTRDRFRGRLIFPIRDLQGRTIGFGGRILPDAEKKLAEAGHGVAKYLNSPETTLFHKRRTLYAADLAREAARRAGWIAVVEGYTDVIAAHQAGMAQCVGTLGTALGDAHVTTLRRLADRVVLVFDGDEAGQKAADRSLELFLGHEVDVRVLTLPDGLDPADFLEKRGAAAFHTLVDQAGDPLDFLIGRAEARFDFGSAEGTRRAAEWVLAILAGVPQRGGAGLDLKLAKALDTLAHRLGLPVESLRRELRRLRKGKRPGASSSTSMAEPAGGDGVSETTSRPIRPEALDPLDRELVQVVLNEPALAAGLITRIVPEALADEPLRVILRACFDLATTGLAAGGFGPYDSEDGTPTEPPTPEAILARLDDPAIRNLATSLLLPPDPAPLPENVRPAPWAERLSGVLTRLAERDWDQRLRELRAAMNETDPTNEPDQYRALRAEYMQVRNQRPHYKKKPTAS